MNGRYLLDTNILIALFANDTNVQNKLNQANEVLIPNVAFGELYYGARKSGRLEANIQRVHELLITSSVLNCDVETAQHYAIIKNNLRLKGRPIPENDIWIAAIAMQHDLILVSRDAHFQEVVDIVTETW